MGIKISLPIRNSPQGIGSTAEISLLTFLCHPGKTCKSPMLCNVLRNIFYYLSFYLSYLFSCSTVTPHSLHLGGKGRGNSTQICVQFWHLLWANYPNTSSPKWTLVHGFMEQTEIYWTKYTTRYLSIFKFEFWKRFWRINFQCLAVKHAKMWSHDTDLFYSFFV